MLDRIHYDQRYVSLLEVYRSGSYTAAGSALALTPSAVAQQIRSVERELDTQLFERGDHRLVPTRECEIIITVSYTHLDVYKRQYISSS